jgi:hypothetical protein
MPDMIQTGEEQEKINTLPLSAIRPFGGKIPRPGYSKVCTGREGQYHIPGFAQNFPNIPLHMPFRMFARSWKNIRRICLMPSLPECLANFL